LKEIGIKKPSLISTLKKNKEKAVALVDHNELSQVSDKIDFAQVSYIIDHHKLLAQTEKPIFCRVEPLGSTATIIAKMFQERKIKVSKTIAKLLLAGILSDTLNLVSPTTTVEDKKVAR
ncbi:MAG TPA: manganese-dependent inorganic pyrophosphatase, partial [Candidatus Moranbacteria bacterium]|nr:manganese-dependent inorganic pyrophosphatase [Candidatus Moranbacteria bacterium]